MGELNCSAKVAKLLLTICNAVVMLAGVALFAVGIWFVSDPKATSILKITSTSDSTTHLLVGAAGGIIIFTGFLVFIVGLVGCYGALSHRTGCLSCFSAILIFLVILQVVAAILAGVFRTQITTGLTDAMNSTMKQYINNEILNQSWNFVQYEFKCCGVRDASDWQHVNWTIDAEQAKYVPKTCCSTNSTDFKNPVPLDQDKCYYDAQHGFKDSKWVYYQGCEATLEDWVARQLGPLIGVAVTVIVIEVIGVILSCLLRSRIKSGYEYV